MRHNYEQNPPANGELSAEPTGTSKFCLADSCRVEQAQRGVIQAIKNQISTHVTEEH